MISFINSVLKYTTLSNAVTSESSYNLIIKCMFCKSKYLTNKSFDIFYRTKSEYYKVAGEVPVLSYTF